MVPGTLDAKAKGRASLMLLSIRNLGLDVLRSLSMLRSKKSKSSLVADE
jgi:hypothetical protein